MEQNNNFKVIKQYFKVDYSYEAIRHLLVKKHNIKISSRTFSRLLQQFGLRRKNLKESPVEEIVLAILLELEGSGYDLGYRLLWKRLRNVYELTVKQKTVMKILKVIDPQGVDARKRYKLKKRIYFVPGPNYMWHADNHDKLKRFGFAIYGCIDGFSRKVIWLNMSTTNNDPEVIGYYYLQDIKKLEYLLTILRTDNGTEANLIEDIQKALRYMHNDEHSGENSFLRGKSTRNQRIESYWRQFRQQVGNFYMDLFKTMELENIFNASNPVHVECLRFCFVKLIQVDIEITQKEWNEHRVRKQNCREVQGGIPNELYNFPEKVLSQDYKKNVNLDDVDLLLAKYTKIPQLYSSVFKELVDIAMPDQTMLDPLCAEDAYNLYIKIITCIENQL